MTKLEKVLQVWKQVRDNEKYKTVPQLYKETEKS